MPSWCKLSCLQFYEIVVQFYSLYFYTRVDEGDEYVEDLLVIPCSFGCLCYSNKYMCNTHQMLVAECTVYMGRMFLKMLV